MKIVTWNALRTNLNIIDGVEKLLAAGHDVICLQEIPQKDKNTLKELTPYSTYIEDCIHKGGISYNMVLSKHPITSVQTLPHRPWSSLTLRIRNRKDGMFFQKVEILKEGVIWQVINTHLILNAPPLIRIAEWIRMSRHMAPHNRTLICGDFNTFASPLWSIIVAWYMDYRWKDFFTHERKQMEAFLRKKKLINPFSQRTQTYLPYQLDFILFKESLKFSNATRWPERYGSDHWPLSIQLHP